MFGKNPPLLCTANKVGEGDAELTLAHSGKMRRRVEPGLHGTGGDVRIFLIEFIELAHP